MVLKIDTLKTKDYQEEASKQQIDHEVGSLQSVTKQSGHLLQEASLNPRLKSSFKEASFQNWATKSFEKIEPTLVDGAKGAVIGATTAAALEGFSRSIKIHEAAEAVKAATLELHNAKQLHSSIGVNIASHLEEGGSHHVKLFHQSKEAYRSVIGRQALLNKSLTESARVNGTSVAKTAAKRAVAGAIIGTAAGVAVKVVSGVVGLALEVLNPDEAL